MITVFAKDDFFALGGVAGEFDRGFYGLGAGIAKEHFVQVVRRGFQDFLRQ